MRKVVFIVIALSVVLVSTLPAAAQDRPVTGLTTFTLDNGLAVFVVENHTVPLARIEIEFRTGGISQSPQTAGLFHLYEHMMFKGNRAYPNQTALQSAMRDLGVSDWNGGTNVEAVSYYFTVPSDRTEKGIEFWADAVRFPLLNPAELATEKDVVVNEILANFSDPGNQLGAAIMKTMFWKYPWRKDVAGSEALVRAATVPVLKQIQDTWYVPNNAALFVAGDVDPAAVRAAAQKYFGDWKRTPDPWAAPPPPDPPLPRDQLLVAADDQMYPGIVSVDLRFRGPDTLRSASTTYVTDVWNKLLDDPNGRFRQSIWTRVPGQYNKDYISVDYLTRRDGGTVGFSTYLVVKPGQDTFARVQALKGAFRDEMKVMASDPSYFGADQYAILKQQLADDRIWERETADGLAGTLSFWWAAASTAYYLGYNDAMAKVTPADIGRFITTTFLRSPSILSVRMNSDDFEKEKASATAGGWSLVTKDSAYWWAAASKGAVK
ncbi:MAG TPA: pitrilysin family protein [Spirochaetia bacterium]|nr:pitrilysin family protein [Spirochaetia bacterium]